MIYSKIVKTLQKVYPAMEMTLQYDTELGELTNSLVTKSYAVLYVSINPYGVLRVVSIPEGFTVQMGNYITNMKTPSSLVKFIKDLLVKQSVTGSKLLLASELIVQDKDKEFSIIYQGVVDILLNKASVFYIKKQADKIEFKVYDRLSNVIKKFEVVYYPGTFYVNMREAFKDKKELLEYIANQTDRAIIRV